MTCHAKYLVRADFFSLIDFHKALLHPFPSSLTTITSRFDIAPPTSPFWRRSLLLDKPDTRHSEIHHRTRTTRDTAFSTSNVNGSWYISKSHFLVVYRILWSVYTIFIQMSTPNHTFGLIRRQAGTPQRQQPNGAKWASKNPVAV